MDKILRINVGAEGGPKAVIEPVGRYATLGGRAMTSTVLWEEVPPDCDPRGPQNKLILAPGIMGGSVATTSGRLSVGCKSPLTGTIKESNAGGQAGHAIARLGYGAIILEGERKVDGLLKLVIDKDGATFAACDELKMLGNYEVAEKIKAEHGDKVVMLGIGPAGEQLLGNSSIAVTDKDFRPTRHAARGGPGAVMGSKGIKVIVIDTEGVSMRRAVDAKGFTEANRKLAKALQDSGYTGQALPAYGSAMLVELVNELGAFPALGARQGQWDESEKISGPTLVETEIERGGEGAATHGCHTGCIIRCSGTFRDKKGKFVTKQPEYETLWAHGGYCGISDLDSIAQMDRLDDDLGLDTIEMGCTIGVMMQAGELEMGDAEGAIALLEEVGRGSEKGKLIGSGAAAVAKHYGVDRAPVVKGQAMAAYDPRAMKGLGVTYATSPMGADHTAGNTLAHHLYMAEPIVPALATDEQWLVSAIEQINSAAIDSTGYCLFLSFAALDQPEAMQYLLESMSAFTGADYTGESFMEMGRSVLKKELDFNRRAGFTQQDDKLPDYVMNEPLAPHDAVFDVPEDQFKQVNDYIKESGSQS
ncbi:aldehyde ferredoxin oxidoreductase C-terminal domain-containing protein [Desulforhopalus singaporensis]|uniref:Aldehyde:ferredoxin oxidoreductase n=1 Tax=Desulforhopalus singaporensis TaxID=91360 RepID=A0A1H0V7E2_9BACT|nr:aldehyde ferredoxin oxidoreductase C-terminal domain-containing protein [Desulforhopalus singaporensis]SDP74303.1 aldehyde:ferredoxin oxidoreductase [Desulforhopalus singaporensis]